MEELGKDFRVLAPNLRGYGKTSSWPGAKTLNLSDKVQLIEPLIDSSEQKVYLIGHSYGGSVALKAAMNFPEKTEGLLLLEPNPFYLLRQNQRMEGYREALELRDQIRKHGSKKIGHQPRIILQITGSVHVLWRTCLKSENISSSRA